MAKRKKPSKIARFWQTVRQERLHRLALFLAVLLLLGAIGIINFEPNMNFADGIWWSIVTLTTVGYGDISPSTPGGRIIGAALMLLGIGVIGTLTGTLASFFVERKIKVRRGMADYDLQQHTVLCEWNNHAEAIIEEFRADDRTRDKVVALIAEVDEKPIDDDLVYFIRGAVTEETLKRAAIADAETVIILGDQKLDITSRDAKVVLATLTVEDLNHDAYTIVEIADESNAGHCRRAQANEIIVTSEFNSRLISRAARDHGLSQVLHEILSSKSGADLQKRQMPTNLVKQTFLDAFMQLKRDHGATILGIQHGVDGAVETNPNSDYILQDSDYLIVVA